MVSKSITAIALCQRDNTLRNTGRCSQASQLGKIVVLRRFKLFDYGKTNRVFCWIMTSKRNHNNKAIILNETWPKRCDKYEFFTDDDNTTFPSVGVFRNLTDGHIHLWAKTKAALRYIYDRHLDEFEWFLKADDDTYIVVENLRLMLRRFDSSLPHYLGFRMAPYIDVGYNSGGAGYVLSRSAIVAFVERALTNKTICSDGWAEDLQLAYCLRNVGINPGDSRDPSGRHTFFPYHPNHHMAGTIPGNGDPKFWYYYQMNKSFDAFSEHLVSMHHLSPTELRLIDLLLYRVEAPIA